MPVKPYGSGERTSGAYSWIHGSNTTESYLTSVRVLPTSSHHLISHLCIRTYTARDRSCPLRTRTRQQPQQTRVISAHHRNNQTRPVCYPRLRRIHLRAEGRRASRTREARSVFSLWHSPSLPSASPFESPVHLADLTIGGFQVRQNRGVSR